jgi:hypothetical protein
MAFARLFNAAVLVRPCPLAPGISGQYATYHRPSRSTTAVNSFRIWSSSLFSHRTTLPVATWRCRTLRLTGRRSRSGPVCC